MKHFSKKHMVRIVKNLFHLINAFFASIFYSFPAKKLTVIGVTGTDGKTTTTHLIYEILKQAGLKAAMISTVEARIDGKSYDTGFHVTTPSPWQLQKLIKKVVDSQAEYIVLETTSHALDQSRIFGCSVDIGVVTNISHEHLDYHKTLESYKEAKAKILNGVKFSVLNKDEANFEYLQRKASGKVVTFSLEGKADYSLSDFHFKPKIPGRFNLYNCLAAATISSIIGISKKNIEKAITSFKGIPGRTEEIETKRNFRVIVDFAHKPNALKEVLAWVRKITRNKLIVVFGCAGERDRFKRPMMGEIAGKMADYIILTAEDPRSEDVRDIIDEIAEGCKKTKVQVGEKKNTISFLKSNRKYFFQIPDRQEAINFAIRKLAKSGDVILLCGKGHEQSMCYGRTEYPWDEKQAVNKALYGKV